MNFDVSYNHQLLDGVGVNEAQKVIHEYSTSYKSDEWEATIPFVVSTPSYSSKSNGIYTEHPNVLEFLKVQYSGMRVYFDPTMYPSPLLKLEGHDGLRKLKIDLERVSRDNGFNLISFGGNCDLRARMVCKSYQRYSTTDNGNGNENLRKTSLHNDRNNSHGKVGQTQQRRQKKIQPMSKNTTCPFRFYLKYDSFGIYFVCGSGCSHHKHHPKMLPKEMLFPSRLLSSPTKKTSKQLGGAYANCIYMMMTAPVSVRRLIVTTPLVIY